MAPFVSCFYSHLLYRIICVKLFDHESLYFKELHNDQEYYWPTIYRVGGAVLSTTTSKYFLFKGGVNRGTAFIEEIKYFVSSYNRILWFPL